MTLFCLHGFLGLPRDWDNFEGAIGQLVPALSAPGAVVKADLFGAEAFPETLSIPDWADAYCSQLVLPRSANGSKRENYLLGYSLGGRLALHMAARFPDLWDGIVIVGANPGLESEPLRAARRAHDETWARRFEAEPWDVLMHAWDAQGVFAGKTNALPARRGQDFSRPALAASLRRWSLGAQPPVWDSLPRLTCPLLWVAGEDDSGQKSICQRLRLEVPDMEIWVAHGAAHRVPWEQPQAFTARVGEFITVAQAAKGAL